MNNPYNQNSAKTEKTSPMADFVYPSRPDNLAPPLSFFAFIAYLCLAIMHALQFTVIEHFGGFYVDELLQTIDPVALLLSLLWVACTLLALIPVAIVVIVYLTDREQHKKTARLLTVLHLCGIVLSLVTDFLISGVPSVVSLISWAFIGALFCLAHYSKAKVYDLKNNLHAAIFMVMILLTLSFVFLAFV